MLLLKHSLFQRIILAKPRFSPESMPLRGGCRLRISRAISKRNCSKAVFQPCRIVIYFSSFYHGFMPCVKLLGAVQRPYGECFFTSAPPHPGRQGADMQSAPGVLVIIRHVSFTSSYRNKQACAFYISNSICRLLMVHDWNPTHFAPQARRRTNATARHWCL